MKLLKKKMQRRDFIRSIAKAGLTIPFTSQFLLAPNVFAQSTGAKRFVMLFYPNGCVRDTWHSYDTGVLGANSFNSSPLQHLSAYADKLVGFKNLTYAGHGGNSGHPESCRGVFSGGQERNTTFDVSLGEALPGRLINNMHVGVWSSRAISTEHMPFTDKNRTKIDVPDDPQLIYDNLISDAVGNGSGGGEQTPEDVRRQRVLETLLENIDVLQSYNLDVQQQDKLLSHEESLNFYKNVLNSTVDIGDGTGFSRPTIGMTGVNEDANDIAKAQMRNIAMAFQADITNVASFQFMGAQDESLMINFPEVRPFMGEFGSEPRLFWNEVRSHVSSHNESDLFNAQTHWYNMMVAYLLDQLNERDDPKFGGKLIDNTMVLVMSEVGGGNHQQDNPGVYVVGGAGGAINSGVGLDAQGAGMSNLYLDIAQSFGLNWDRYGNSFGGVGGFRA